MSKPESGSEPKHTPGPWEAVTFGDSVYIETPRTPEGTRYHIGEVAFSDEALDEQNQANARLIAAAPDLLHFARWAAQTCDGPSPLNDEQLRRHIGRRAKELIEQAAGHE